MQISSINYLAVILIVQCVSALPITRWQKIRDRTLRTRNHFNRRWGSLHSDYIVDSDLGIYSGGNIDDDDESDYLESPIQVFIVEPEESNLRVDTFLSLKLDSESRTNIGDLCSSGRVKLDGKSIKKSHKLKPGQCVSVQFGFISLMPCEPEDVPLDILYEDEHIIAVSKPVGMVVHPAPGNRNGTFVNALMHHLSTEERNDLMNYNDIRPGIVHRLDKGTSGVLLAAKNSIAQRKLSELFHDRKVTKKYVSICVGNPGRNLRIKDPIGRHRTNRIKMTSKEFDPKVKSRSAVSCVDTLAYDGKLSVVEVNIETGRKHQIRVHLQDCGHPVIGDDLYGDMNWNRKLHRLVRRPLLHALECKFPHPINHQPMCVTSPLPFDLTQFVLRIYPNAKIDRPEWFDEMSVECNTIEASLENQLSSENIIVEDSVDWYK